MIFRIVLFLVLTSSQAFACASSPCSVSNQTEMADAITFANGSLTPTVINVTASFTRSDTLPTITSNVTINGNGNTITGANVTPGFNRIFDIGNTSGTRINVAINGLTLTGGYATGGTGFGGGMGAGGAIYVNANANVAATDVVLTNNTARGGYGGTAPAGGGMNADNQNPAMGNFGGGGGTNSYGGFGGGGGINRPGGFSAGNGNGGQGGGGAGLGGAVFVREGGSFIITNTTNNTMSGNYSVGGLGGNSGRGGADGLFLQGNGTLNISASAGTVTTLSNTIVDQTGGNTASLSMTGLPIQNYSPGSYTLVKDGAGTVSITSIVAVAGGTTINNGTLEIVGSNAMSGVLLGNIIVSDGANFTSRHSDNNTLSNNISGAGSVTQAGTGILTLSGTNTYSGGTNLNAGTVSITNDAQLGAASGAINFNGGTLVSGGTITSIRGGTVNAASKISTTGTLKLGGVFSGASNLTIQGTGYTYLTGDNTYTGTTTVNSGAKLVLGDNSTTGSVAGAIIDNGALLISRSNSFTFNNTLTGTGSFEKLGTGTMILTSTLANSGAKTITAGTLQVENGGSLGTSAITNNATLTYNRTDDLTVSNVISGTGALVKDGANTLTLTGTSGYSGATSVNSGTLIVDGALANSSVTVATGATLGGTTSGFSTNFKNITNNGIVNPGGAGANIGHIGMNGNFVNNGTLAIDITANTNDTVQIYGNATLGGTLNLRPTGTGYTAGQTFYIVNTPSAGNLQGTKFTNVTVTGSFGTLRPVVSYDNDDISITLKQASIASLITPRGSANVMNTANAIDKMLEAGVTSPLFDALFNLPGAELPGVIAKLSGEISNTSKQAGLATGNLFMRSMHDPFNAMLCVSNCDGGNVVLREMAGNKASVTRALPASRGKWFGWSTIDVGQETTTGGNTTTITPLLAATGLEYRANDRAAFGFALSGGSAGYRIDNGLGSGTNNSALLGVYGRLASGDYLLSASVFTGWQGVETKRSVLTENLSGKTDGVSLGSRLELSRRFGFLSPYAALQAQTIRLNGYSEKGIDGSAATAALTYSSQAAHSLRSEFGLGGEYELSAFSRLNFRLGWAHEFANPVTTYASFNGGFGFQTTGATASPDSLLLKSGFEHNLSNALRVKAGLTGEFSAQSRVIAADASLKWAW